MEVMQLNYLTKDFTGAGVGNVDFSTIRQTIGITVPLRQVLSVSAFYVTEDFDWTRQVGIL